MYRGAIRTTLGAVAAISVALVAAPSVAADGAAQLPIADSSATRSATPPITLRIDGLKHHRARVLDRYRVEGRLNADPGQWVRVRVYASGRKLLAKSLKTDPDTGAYGMPLGIRACCRYKVVATYRNLASEPVRFRVHVPRLKDGRITKFFHTLMRAAGYHVDLSRHLNGASKLAILAFRKVNGMARTDQYSSKIFRKLLLGKGSFHLEYPKAGKHVEVDLSRQVMVLANKNGPVGTFHISSGAPATPTIQGKFNFYSKSAGFNEKGMYYSVYFHGGYATHGYESVPTYPASHGCVRNPIPNSIWIYNWIDIGDPIWVYP